MKKSKRNYKRNSNRKRNKNYKKGGAKEGGLGLLPNIGDAASVTLDAAPENFNATLLRKLFIFNTIYSLVYLQ